MTSVFVCHSSKDKPFVRKLARGLRGAGVMVWIDEAEIRVGDSIIQKISEAISDKDYVIAVISNSSASSKWVRKELDLAMTMEIEGSAPVILPVKIDTRAAVPAAIREKLYADFTGWRKAQKFRKALQGLLTAIGVGDETPGRAVTLRDVPASIVGPHVLLEAFTDIRLTGNAPGSTSRSSMRASRLNLLFRLSETPPYDWVMIFEALGRFSRERMWRMTRVEDGRILVLCNSVDNRSRLTQRIKRDVKEANRIYREYLRLLLS